MDTTCPICLLESPDVKTEPRTGRNTIYDCARCGKFNITKTALTMVSSDRSLIDPRMPAWIREQKLNDSSAPEINNQNLKSIPANFPTYSVTQKQLLLLRKIEKDTKYPGAGVLLCPNFDYPIVWATRYEEFQYYVRSLIDRGLISLIDDTLA